METLNPHFKAFSAFCSYFKDEETCVSYYAAFRWCGKPKCPYCDHSAWVCNVNGKSVFRCSSIKCNRSFSVKKGTIFENSHLPLMKWFQAIYLFNRSTHSISSISFGNLLGMSQSAAWRLLVKIRILMDEVPEAKDMFQGVVELDETFIGGKYKNKHWDKKKKGQQGRSWVDKFPIFGVKERATKMRRSIPILNTSGDQLHYQVYNNVEEGTTLMTDEWKGYNGLEVDYNRLIVDHSIKQYVNGDCHTNGLENHWSHMKRKIIGVYHWISKKYAPIYCKEFDFRQNMKMAGMTIEEKFDLLLLYSLGHSTKAFRI